MGARKRVEEGAEFGKDEFESYWKFAPLTDGPDAAEVRDGVISARLEKDGAAPKRPGE